MAAHESSDGRGERRCHGKASEPPLATGKNLSRPVTEAAWGRKLTWLDALPGKREETMTTTYTPKPIDTSGVALSEEILALTERLAEHNHDIWATGRIKEGWSYGPRRDDTLKQNPCLVPYRELPESEKEYDRKTALEALKLILAAGYKIVKAPGTV
jgi:hypothetical protein